jgi:hypothetical protein
MLDHREQRFVLEELLQAGRQAGERVERLEQAIREVLADWSLAPIVPALMAMRGIDLIAAGDHRFWLHRSWFMEKDFLVAWLMVLLLWSAF